MKRRFSVAVLAPILFCLVSLSPSPSNPSVPTPAAMTAIPAPAVSPAADDAAVRLAELAAAKAEAAEIQRRILNTLPYGSIIARSAARNSLDGLLLAAVVDIESGFTAEAISPQGARGLMQVRPSTATFLGHDGDLLDPHTNVEVGSRYLGSLLQDFDGNVELSLAAYNAGPSAVLRHNGIPPYPETRAYVKKVLHRYQDLRREASALETGLAESGLKGPSSI
jgi:soluble lytic murein transglycosylase-like protein